MQYYHRKDIETQSGHTIAQWNFTPGLEMNLGSNDSNSSTVVTVVALIMAQNRIRAQFKIFCRNYGPYPNYGPILLHSRKTETK